MIFCLKKVGNQSWPDLLGAMAQANVGNAKLSSIQHISVGTRAAKAKTDLETFSVSTQMGEVDFRFP